MKRVEFFSRFGYVNEAKKIIWPLVYAGCFVEKMMPDVSVKFTLLDFIQKDIPYCTEKSSNTGKYWEYIVHIALILRCSQHLPQQQTPSPGYETGK